MRDVATYARHDLKLNSTLDSNQFTSFAHQNKMLVRKRVPPRLLSQHEIACVPMKRSNGELRLPLDPRCVMKSETSLFFSKIFPFLVQTSIAFFTKQAFT